MSVRRTEIEVRGARTHNLRDIDVDIPLDRCTILVGPSGSGKSSLAFGTVHAAAHAAYLEGISSYARFTEKRLAAPDVDAIHNLRPTLALSQGYGARSTRSTVGTVTDALALLRLLFSRVGQPTRSAGQLSFLSPEGMCPTCGGTGTALSPDLDRLVDRRRTLKEGALQHRAWKVGGRYWNILAATERVPLDVRISDLEPQHVDFLLYEPPLEASNSSPGFVQRFTYEGVVPRLLKRIGDARALEGRAYDLTFFQEEPCPECGGTRLSRAAREVRIGEVSFADVVAYEISEVLEFLTGLTDPVSRSIQKRLVPLLERIVQMGLGYLALDRSTTTLSGGELRRIRIAHQLTSSLNGLVYVVDEASAGLHHEEAKSIYASMRELTDAGNTVLLVDHADGALAVADHVFQLGPGGGVHGGEVVWSGRAAEYDGPYGRLARIDRARRPIGNDFFRVEARLHNLRGEVVEIPQRRFVVIAGPSGSGKSSLALEISAQVPSAKLLSQRDIGGSVRSVIATYLGVFDGIRKLFAAESGLRPGDFSFNGPGACPVCGGWGLLRMEMQFLEDVESVCEECGGRRYMAERLETRVRGLSIADVLELTVAQAASVFEGHAAISRGLETAVAVGIGHLVLGQSTDTLSGGESQRLAVATAAGQSRRQVLLLDEPTRGLGADEVPLFLGLVDELLDKGASVVAIEHDLSVIGASDWVVEVGPGGGNQGGWMVAAGTPEQIVAAKTLTGRGLELLS